MSSVALQANTVKIAAPEFRGASLDLGSCRDIEVCLDGPAGCVAGETRIYNPVSGEHTPIRELCKKGIAPIVQTLMGAIQAEVPFRKGVADLYRVTLASGHQCVVTGNHLFLTPSGWHFAASCAVGSRLLASWPCPQESIEAPGPLVSLQDALHLSQTPLGSQERCFAYSHPCDVQPQWEAGNALAVAPLQGGVRAHSHADLYGDDWAFSREYTHRSQRSDLHARTYCAPSSAYMACAQFHGQPGTSLPVGALFQYGAQSQRETDPLLPTVLLQQHAGNMPRHAPSLVECPPALEDQLHGEVVNLTPEQLASCFLFSGTSQGCVGTLLDSYVCIPSSFTSNDIMPSAKYEYTSQWDTVSSIKYERTDEYFDLHVPIAEHYLAEGIWHHNTGKTYAALYKVHILLLMHPGARALVARKTSTALSGSAMVTFREDILRSEEGVVYFGGNRIKPAAFHYPNGSELVLNGLDKPEKVKSTAFDVALINEATECTVDDIEFVRSRLRHGKLPYHQLIMDVNPDAPGHWLNLRMNDGTTTRLLSRHEHNPRYFSLITNDWTPEGREYIFNILGGLTGVRLARLRYGIWSSAEGAVYQDSYDRARNVISPFPIPVTWQRYCVLDFGYTHPFVAKFYAEDPDGRLYMYREFYHTKMLVEDHVKRIKQVARWGQDGGDPLPRAVIADHDAEDRETFTRHSGLYTIPAHKSVSDGIQAVASRLRPAGDGKPRLMYFNTALVDPDPELMKAKKPKCTIEEFDSYIWDTRAGMKRGEQPFKESDHGMDCDRYMVAYKDLHPDKIRYSDRVY